MSLKIICHADKLLQLETTDNLPTMNERCKEADILKSASTFLALSFFFF